MSISYKYNDTGENVRLLQKALNEILKLRLITDGHYGKLTEEAVRTYQKMNNLTVDGVYAGPITEHIEHYISQRFLRINDIVEQANNIGVPASMLLAFKEVESAGEGFLPDGRSKILFERHKMYDQLRILASAQFADSMAKIHPNIVNKERGGYQGHEAEHKRLDIAMGINKIAALKSASWGLFQIMGFNHNLCGYPNVIDFVEANKRSEKDQLTCVVRFIQGQPNLLAAIRQRNHLRTAQLYNGPAQQGYDVKLRDADRKYVGLGY